MRTHCTLYTFAKNGYEGRTPNGVVLVKVARLTAKHPDDWHIWPERYCQDRPGLRLIEIPGIEFVDERELDGATPPPQTVNRPGFSGGSNF